MMDFMNFAGSIVWKGRKGIEDGGQNDAALGSGVLPPGKAVDVAWVALVLFALDAEDDEDDTVAEHGV